MNLTPIVERLRGTGVFRAVDGVLALADIEAHLGQLPAAFVVPESEAAEPNRLAAGAHDQRCEEIFTIVLVVGAAAARTARPAEDLQRGRDATLAALVGWSHPDASGPTDYAGARLLAAGGGRVLYGVRVRMPWRLRKVT